MEYKSITKGIFLSRPNRFIAHVLVDGQEEVVHVKNTGRCRELLMEGACVLLQKGDNPKRKTTYSLVAVYKGDVLVNMDSSAPNKVVGEALESGLIHEIGPVSRWKPEVKYGASRFDFSFETKEGQKGFIEVKGVTLEENGVARFPDAPTERGTRHIREMIEAVKNGYLGVILFVVQLKGCHTFFANEVTDPNFAVALEEAKAAGVLVLVYDCVVWEKGMALQGHLKGKNS